jgi:hypothetical protein
MVAAGYPVRPDRSSRSYQSVDATPLFLILAAMAGFPGPAVEAALGWLDGRGVDPPVAVASAQAFAYAALRGHGRQKAAAALADRFEAAFYGYGRPWPALAMDGQGAAVDTLASEIGIVLWAGLLRPGRVEGAVAGLERLATPCGLRAAGAAEAAARVRGGVLDASAGSAGCPNAMRSRPTARGRGSCPGPTGPRPGRRGRCGRWRPAGTAAAPTGTEPRPGMLGSHRPEDRRTWELAAGGGGDDAS